MSIQAVSWVLDHSEVGGSERLVMISLANHADADGIAGPSQNTIAGEARVSPDTVRRALTSLAAGGEIEEVGAEEERPAWWHALPRNKRTRVWRLLGVAKCHPSEDGQGSRRGGTGVAQGSRSYATQTYKPETEKPPTTRASDSSSLVAEFDLWWKEYPRRPGNRDKPAARKKYLTLRKAGVTADDLATAAKQYARERVDEDPQYTMGERRFLEGTDGPWWEALDRSRRPARRDGPVTADELARAQAPLDPDDPRIR